MKAHLMINELFQPIKRALKLQGHAHACERARMAMLREKSRLAEQVRRSGIQKVKGKKEKSNSKKPVPLSKRIRDIVRLLKRVSTRAGFFTV